MRLALFRCSFRLSLLVVACGCSNAPSNTGAPGVGGTGPVAGAAATGGSAGAAAGTAATAGSPGSGAGAGGSSAGSGGSSAGSGGATGGTGGAGAGGTAGGVAGSGGATSAGTGGGGVSTTGTGSKGATVFYDFEECATPAGWTVPNYPTDPGEGNQGAGSLLVDMEKAHGGKCSLHMKDFSGDQPQHALLADLPKGFGPVLWGRAWMFNTGAPTQHGALIKTRYTVPNSPDVDWYEVGYEKQNYDGIWHSPLPPSGLPEWVLQSNTTIVINAWTCVEWLFDTQNSAGVEAADPRIWQDGVEVTFKPGFEYDLSGVQGKPRPPTPKGTDFVGIEVGLTMYHAIDMKMNFYMDDLALGKERIGCAN